MKNKIAGAALFVAGLIGAGQSLAAGPYDGVYQFGLSQSFHSVHQNGNTLLVVSLSTLPTEDTYYRFGSYTIEALTVGNWDYALGQMVGNTARISGTNLYGACITTTDITFENGTATATFVSTVNTPYGTAQGVNCKQLYQEALQSLGTSSLTLRKIF